MKFKKIYNTKTICINNIRIMIFLICVSSFCGCAKDILIRDAKYNSENYPMFGKEMGRTFFVPTTVSDSINLKWSTETHGGIFNSSLIIQGDYIFIADLSGRIYAFNINTGKQNGYLNYKGSVSASPILDMLKLIFAADVSQEDNSIIYNYDIKTGKVIYKIDIDGIILNDIVKLDNGFIFTTEQGTVCRYNFNSDKTWEYKNDWYIHSSPAANNKAVIYGDDKGYVTGLDINNGKVMYKEQFSSGFDSGFSVSGDTAYAGDKLGNLYAIDIISGRIFWIFKTSGGIITYPVIDNDYIYIGNLNGDVYKLVKSSGEQVWKIITDGVINVTPLLFNNRLVQPDLNKKIYFINVDSGEIEKTMELENRPVLSPVYFNQTLFLGTDYGQIFAYEFVK